MKTREIFLVSVMFLLTLGVSVKATEAVTSNSVENSISNEITRKVSNFIEDKLEMTREMDNTFALVYFQVDTKGKISFTNVDYEDRDMARSLELVVDRLDIEPTTLKQGKYYIKVWFKVR
ncbi:MAG TPA: hypothetical protein PK252_05295 [Bacteroidales bacterium]|nr:hypothetical protein [Bacteroidales bacterium]